MFDRTHFMVTQVTEDADTLIIKVSLDLYTVIVIF